MRLLLDTHTLLWFLANDVRLSRAAKTGIEDVANERWLSPISLLEIAIKVRIGKLQLPAPFGVMFPADLLAADIDLLPLEVDQIEPLTTLPLHHKDPFDRLIAAPLRRRGLDGRLHRPGFRCLRGVTTLVKEGELGSAGHGAASSATVRRAGFAEEPGVNRRSSWAPELKGRSQDAIGNPESGEHVINPRRSSRPGWRDFNNSLILHRGAAASESCLEPDRIE